eukprot:scaffold36358_cov63-Phaeocystis_antarctica.AAC.1
MRRSRDARKVYREVSRTTWGMREQDRRKRLRVRRERERWGSTCERLGLGGGGICERRCGIEGTRNTSSAV